MTTNQGITPEHLRNLGNVPSSTDEPEVQIHGILTGYATHLAQEFGNDRGWNGADQQRVVDQIQALITQEVSKAVVDALERVQVHVDKNDSDMVLDQKAYRVWKNVTYAIQEILKHGINDLEELKKDIGNKNG